MKCFVSEDSGVQLSVFKQGSTYKLKRLLPTRLDFGRNSLFLNEFKIMVFKRQIAKDLNKLFFLILFISISFYANATTISGFVTNECTGEPIANGKVRIYGGGFPGPNTFFAYTDSDGRWEHTFNEGTNGVYVITLTSPGGSTLPAAHTYLTSQGSVGGLNFELLPSDNLQICVRQFKYPSSNIPNGASCNFPITLATCDDLSRCLTVFKNGEVITRETEGYCYNYSVYEMDEFCNQGSLMLTGNTFNFLRPWIGQFGDDCAFCTIEIPIEDLPPFTTYRLEFEMKCCDDGINTETIEMFFEVEHEVEPDESNFDFGTIAGSPLDVGTSNDDGIIPNIGCEGNGAEIGRFGLIRPSTIAANVQEWEFSVQKVDCSTGEPDGMPGVYSSTATGNVPPFSIGTVLPTLLSDPLGSCYVGTLTVSNLCGKASTCGNFFLTENPDHQFFKLKNEESDFRSVTQDLSINYSETEEDINLDKIEASIFPNPFSKSITFNFSQEILSEVEIMIFDSKGTKINGIVIDSGVSNYRWENSLPAGVYFYKIKNAENIIKQGRIIKVQ